MFYIFLVTLITRNIIRLRLKFEFWDTLCTYIRHYYEYITHFVAQRYCTIFFLISVICNLVKDITDLKLLCTLHQSSIKIDLNNAPDPLNKFFSEFTILWLFVIVFTLMLYCCHNVRRHFIWNLPSCKKFRYS